MTTVAAKLPLKSFNVAAFPYKIESIRKYHLYQYYNHLIKLTFNGNIFYSKHLTPSPWFWALIMILEV